MGLPTDQASEMIVPSGDATAPYDEQRLANTGTTESSNATGLVVGSMATLVVGGVAVRVRWRGSAGLATQVATTQQIVPAYGRIDWTVLKGKSEYVYVEAADAASAYEAWVWSSSP
jgi:hypothetical protein